MMIDTDSDLFRQQDGFTQNKIRMSTAMNQQRFTRSRTVELMPLTV